MESLHWLSVFMSECADKLEAPQRARDAFKQAAEILDLLRQSEN